MSTNFKLLFRKVRYVVKDFPIVEPKDWLSYIRTYLKYGFHKNHVRHQPIKNIRSDRFIKYLSANLSGPGFLSTLEGASDYLPRPRKVLITNSSIGGRSGTETWIYEICQWLQSKGIEVLVYAPHVNRANSDTLRNIPHTTSQSEAIRFNPDILHLQHVGHHKIAELVAQFDGLPIFNMLHGVSDQIEIPLDHADRQIVYCGVSRLICRKTSFLTKKRVLLLKNFTTRSADFKKVVPPIRVVGVSSKIPTEIRKKLTELFNSFNISYQSFGHDADSFIWDYELNDGKLMGNHLVLSTGKTTIDFLGMGFNAMLCEGNLLGPVVTEQNYRFLSDMNFALASPLVPTVDVLSSEAETWLLAQLDELMTVDAGTLRTLRDQENSIEVIGQQLLKAYSGLMANELKDALCC